MSYEDGCAREARCIDDGSGEGCGWEISRWDCEDDAGKHADEHGHLVIIVETSGICPGNYKHGSRFSFAGADDKK